ncbi:MAG TPA: hypothetical protein VIV60_35325, partial [Polyangiaceae bacterium]
LPEHARTMQVGAHQFTLMAWPSWGPTVLFGMGVAGAVMTAFYMTRLVIGIFFGDFKGWTIVAATPGAGTHAGHADADAEQKSEAQESAHAHHGPVAGLELEGQAPHESPWQMTLPLLILGALALVAGFLNAPLFHITPLEHLLAPLFESLEGVTTRPDSAVLEHELLYFGVGAFALGVGAAYWVYVAQRGKPAEAFTMRYSGLHRLVLDKWRIDELYQETVIGALEILADMSVWLDKWVVDGIIARASAFVVAASGAILRLLQTGHVQAYASFIVVGLGGVGWYLATPHAQTNVEADAQSGRYVVSATPGLGYTYRWDENGDGQWDVKEFGSQRSVEVSLNRAERRQIKLQVLNAFGRVAEAVVLVERPSEDKSGATTRIDVYDDDSGGLKGAVRRPGSPALAPLHPTLGAAMQGKQP